MHPAPGTPIVPVNRDLRVTGQDWWGDVIALAQEGEHTLYLIVHGEGAPQWITSDEIERSSVYSGRTLVAG
ncbi:MAG: hypothetical protein QOF76_5589 [Solirubrobacteraceae bacterium]|jgi:hypothetical protein|nr:hypothetical protein [Solirubrobacteraceae bacterium]